MNDFLLGVIAGVVSSALVGAAGWGWVRRRGTGLHAEVELEYGGWDVTLNSPQPDELFDLKTPWGETRPTAGFVVRAWLDAFEAADLSRSQLKLFLTGRSDRRITITNITAVVRTRTSVAPSHTRVFAIAEGEEAALELSLKLDDTHPALAGSDGRPYFATHNLSLVNGEIQEIWIDALVNAGYVEWTLEIDYKLGRRARRLRVDNRGQPFRTAGLPAGADWRREYQWDFNGANGWGFYRAS